MRYYLSAKDFSRAVCLLIKKRDKGIFNVGSKDFFTNIQVATAICKILQKDTKKYIKFVKDRPFNDKRYCVSTNKIRKLGWSPKNSLMKDLAYIIEWYIRNKRLFKNFN